MAVQVVTSETQYNDRAQFIKNHKGNNNFIGPSLTITFTVQLNLNLVFYVTDLKICCKKAANNINPGQEFREG